MNHVMNTPRSNKFRAMLPLLIDIVAPIVIYYILHSLGVGDVIALTLSGMVAGINTVIQTVRRRRLDGIGLLVVIEIALSILLLFITNDPRIILIKPSVYVGIAGVYALVTCFVGRPFSFDAGKPMATKGDPLRLAAYERAWERSEKFRHGERALTAGWGLAMLAEAIFRVIVVYQFSEHEVGKSLISSQLPGIVLIVFIAVYTRICIRPLKKIVDDLYKEFTEKRGKPQQQ